MIRFIIQLTWKSDNYKVQCVLASVAVKQIAAIVNFRIKSMIKPAMMCQNLKPSTLV